MVKHTLKILGLSHRMIFKVFLANFQHYEFREFYEYVREFLYNFIKKVSIAESAQIFFRAKLHEKQLGLIFLLH